MGKQGQNYDITHWQAYCICPVYAFCPHHPWICYRPGKSECTVRYPISLMVYPSVVTTANAIFALCTTFACYLRAYSCNIHVDPGHEALVDWLKSIDNFMNGLKI